MPVLDLAHAGAISSPTPDEVYDPGGPGWYGYGLGSVTPDGRQIVPDPGVSIYEFTGAMVGAAPPRKPDEGGGCEWPSDCPKDGDPVALSTGHFTLTKRDVVLPGPLPIALERTFVAGETVIRPFGMAATHTYAIFIAANPGSRTGISTSPTASAEVVKSDETVGFGNL